MSQLLILFNIVCDSLAEALDMQPPVMPEDGHTRLTTGDDTSSPGTGKEASVAEALWDDEDTKSFYENLPDLRFVLVRFNMQIIIYFKCMKCCEHYHFVFRAFVPAVLLGETDPKVSDQSSKAQDQPTVSTFNRTAIFKCLTLTNFFIKHQQTKITQDSAPEPDQSQVAAHDTAETSADAAVLSDGKNEKRKDENEKDKGSTKESEKDKGKEKDVEIEKEKVRGPEGTNLDGLLQRLPGCVSRDLIDQLTVIFFFDNFLFDF